MESFIEFISQPWSWWFSGIMIALVYYLLNFFGKEFGMSNNLRTICSVSNTKTAEIFKFDWKSKKWNLFVGLGALIAGFVYFQFIDPSPTANISEKTIETLAENNVFVEKGNVPLIFEEIFSWESLFTLKGFIFIVIGGVLVGFGTAYAGGCTSGHAISGLSNLQLPSLIAVVGFFIGGLAMVHFILPIILKL